jgi:hypothetical protein
MINARKIAASLMIFALHCVACPVAWALDYRTQFGDWTSQSRDGLFEAYTSNENRTSFGLMCSERSCLAYYSTARTCESGAQYPALVNSGNGARPVLLECRDWKTRSVKVLWAQDIYEITQNLRDIEEFSVAFPLANGRFLFSNFSLVGYRQAVLDVVRRSGSGSGAPGRYRDSIQ